MSLYVKTVINSSVEELLGWKCCSLPGMNLEVTVTNRGREPVDISSKMEFCAKGLTEPAPYFYPFGTHRIDPGDSLSFFCNFNELEFKRFSHIVVTGGAGQKLRAAISGEDEPLFAWPQ